MAVQLINVGQIANDGTGDDLREAMIKVNQNFEELDLRDDEQTTASNLGVTGEGIFANKVNYDLQFKKINAGDNIALTADNEKITISYTPTTLTLNSDSGDTALLGSTALAIVGGDGISTSMTDNTLTITKEYVSDIVEDLTPQLGGTLDAQGFDITNAGTISGSFVGNLTGNVNGVDPAESAYYFDNIDLGGIVVNVTNSVELLIATTDIDLGTYGASSAISIDLGSI